MTLTADYLRSRLDYDPETGVLTWRPIQVFDHRHKIWNARFSGKPAGTEHGKGHLKIGIDGKTYFAQRLAWLHFYGEWPKDQADHEDKDKKNNRIANLRDADTSQNKANVEAPRTNTSGVKGVHWNKRRGKWQASIKVKRKKIHLGLYTKLEDGAAAYREAAKQYFGEFAHWTGKPA